MKKLDFIIIFIILLISGAAYFGITYYQSSHEGDVEVVIKHEGSVIKRYAFTDATDETYTYDNNGELNVVVIKNGEVKVTEANCRDQICVETGSISKIGQIIVCLPHEFTVEILSATQTSEIDSIAE